MIKIPARPDGNWTVQFANEKLPDITATRNLTFDKEGYIRLSKPTASVYSSSDDVDFQKVLGFFRGTDPAAWFIVTEDATFTMFLSDYNSTTYDGTITIAQDASANTPVNTSSTPSGAAFFDDNLVVVSTADNKCYKNSLAVIGTTAWTISDTSASLTLGNAFPATNFVNQVELAVGNANQVTMFTTAYAQGAQELTLPSDYKVTGIAWNNGYVGITTRHTNEKNSIFAVWDGSSSEANYIVEVPSKGCNMPVPYQGTFAFISGIGTLYQWVPNGITPLAQLPNYYSDALFGAFDYANNGIVAEGELLHINLHSAYNGGGVDEDNRYYNETMPGGVWTYDPAVGVYHRNAPSGVKIVWQTIATTAVDTSTDKITVTAAPETGTPVVYSEADGTAITGLTTGQWYYTIKVDATTVQLAETYDDAIAGTEIDLTGTGNNNQTLQFYPKTDFGQSYFITPGGAIHIEGEKDELDQYYYQRLFYGATCAIDGTTEYDLAGYAVEATENRGYFVTSKFMSGQLQEDWQKLFIKHSDLNTSLDKIVVKYRTSNNRTLTKIKDGTDGIITWSDADTFTTTDPQWSAVQAGDEVEIIQGTGSGYLLHVDSISEAGGTYTVNLDESVKNLTAAKTGRAIASRWTKLTTLDNGIITNDDGYSEIAVGVKSKQIQFKIELRGEDIEVEEILVAHQLHKPAA